jgi:hypothetical protein
MLIASRNVLAMEAQEQALQAREETPDPTPQQQQQPFIQITQIVEQLFSAVHHIPEAREAMAEQLRLVAMQIRDQANGVHDGKSAAGHSPGESP